MSEVSIYASHIEALTAVKRLSGYVISFVKIQTHSSILQRVDRNVYVEKDKHASSYAHMKHFLINAYATELEECL